MGFSEIWNLSDKWRITNEKQSCIPLKPIVFCYGKYLSSLFFICWFFQQCHNNSSYVRRNTALLICISVIWILKKLLCCPLDLITLYMNILDGCFVHQCNGHSFAKGAGFYVVQRHQMYSLIIYNFRSKDEGIVKAGIYLISERDHTVATCFCNNTSVSSVPLL